MIARRAAGVVVCLLTCASAALAQPRVDPRNMYERVIAVVPLVGKGTVEDPRRPLHAPAPGEISATSRTGIVGFTWVPSDDGKFAIVQFVARDKASLRGILDDAKVPASNVKAFTPSADQKQDIETALKQYKKDIDISKFDVRVP